MRDKLSMTNILFGLGIGSILLLSSCKKEGFHEGVWFAGGKYVSAKSLNAGKATYQDHCIQCHGVKGEGNGPAAKGLKVPPRNLTTGIYKFGRVSAGLLPHDEDFYRILVRGLHGTVMLPWDLGEQEMHDLVQYIKMFAPDVWVGKDKKLGPQIEAENDPFGMAYKESAIEKGAYVYHVKAQCYSCHRAYVSEERLSEYNQMEYGEPLSYVDETMWQLKPQESVWGFKVIPPDFTWHKVRSAATVDELFVRIGAGIAGSGMPAWKDTITDEELWAVSYYVRHLMDMRGDMQAREELLERAKFTGPKVN